MKTLYRKDDVLGTMHHGEAQPDSEHCSITVLTVKSVGGSFAENNEGLEDLYGDEKYVIVKNVPPGIYDQDV